MFLLTFLLSLQLYLVLFRGGKMTKTIALHDANGLLFCLADPTFL